MRQRQRCRLRAPRLHAPHRRAARTCTSPVRLTYDCIKSIAFTDARPVNSTPSRSPTTMRSIRVRVCHESHQRAQERRQRDRRTDRDRRHPSNAQQTRFCHAMSAAPSVYTGVVSVRARAFAHEPHLSEHHGKLPFATIGAQKRETRLSRTFGTRRDTTSHHLQVGMRELIEQTAARLLPQRLRVTARARVSTWRTLAHTEHATYAAELAFICKSDNAPLSACVGAL
jgi:hypothetical protein